jgi:hypothetical protein
MMRRPGQPLWADGDGGDGCPSPENRRGDARVALAEQGREGRSGVRANIDQHGFVEDLTPLTRRVREVLDRLSRLT